MSTHNREVGPVHSTTSPTHPTPILNNLLMSGAVMVDHMQYIGCASDGALCVFPGATDRPDQTEAYLTDFPTPDMW